MYVYMCVCVCVCIYVYKCVCVYVYIYIYIYIYNYVCIYTCIYAYVLLFYRLSLTNKMELMSIKWIILLEIPKSYATCTILTGSKCHVTARIILLYNYYQKIHGFSLCHYCR